MDNRVSLHYADLPTQPWPALERAWLARLPAARAERLRAAREPAARNATLLGFALLTSAGRALGRSPQLGRLRFPPRGKPHWSGGPDFSIAHCPGRVACAVATDGRVGLDLEARGAARAAQLRLALAAQEFAALAAAGLTPTDGFVMKEAAVKAAGGTVADVAQVQLADGVATLHGVTFTLTAVDVGSGFIAWLATDAPVVVAGVHEHLEALGRSAGRVATGGQA